MVFSNTSFRWAWTRPDIYRGYLGASVILGSIVMIAGLALEVATGLAAASASASWAPSSSAAWGYSVMAARPQF